MNVGDAVETDRFPEVARAMVAIGGGPTNEVIVMNDLASCRFIIAVRLEGSPVAYVRATLGYGNNELDEAKVYIHALNFMVLLANDIP